MGFALLFSLFSASFPTGKIPPFQLLSIVSIFALGCCLCWAIRLKKRSVLSEHALNTYKRAHAGFEDGMAVWFCDDTLVRATYDVRTTFAINRGLTFLQSLDAICRKFNSVDAQAIREHIIDLRNDGRNFRLWLPMNDENVVIISGRPEGASFVIRFVNATQEAQEVAQLAARTETTSFEYEQMIQMLNICPTLMWRRTQSLRLNWVNETYAQALVSDPRTVILEQRELTLGQLGSKTATDLAKHAYNSKTPQSQRRQVVVNGSKKVLDIHEMPYADGTIGYAVDVTETLETQKALTHRDHEFSDTLDQLQTGIALFDNKRRLQFFNQSFCQQLQLDTTWLEQQQPDHFDIIDKLRDARRLPEWSNFNDWRTKITELYRQKSSKLQETWHLPDGTIYHVVYKARQAGGMFVLFENVTQRIALERQYNTLVSLRRATFEQLSEGLIVFGMDGYMQFANLAFARIWDIDPARLDTKLHIMDVIEACQSICRDIAVWKYIQGTVTTSGTRQHWREYIYCQDGRTLDTNISPLPDGSILVAFRDVTDAQNIENALREKASALEETDKLKSEFMGHISYQLRTPLNTILGFGEILQREMFGALNAEQHEYIEGILDSSSALLRVVNDILDLSSMEAGTFALDIGPIDIHRTLLSFSEMITNRMHEKHIRFSLNCPETIDFMQGDEKRVRQIIFRLVQNALKYTQPGGEIELGCKRYNDTYIIWVRDSGTGISDQRLKAVFETFNGIKRLGSNKRAGIGIGLTLVKKFVELHRGEINIQSQVDVGTHVECIFPATQQKIDINDNIHAQSYISGNKKR